MQNCAECGKPISPMEPFYTRNPMGLGRGEDWHFHSHCGDPFGIKAEVARAVTAERERCAKIAEDTYGDLGYHPYYRAAGTTISQLIRAVEQEVKSK